METGIRPFWSDINETARRNSRFVVVVVISNLHSLMAIHEKKKKKQKTVKPLDVKGQISILTVGITNFFVFVF